MKYTPYVFLISLMVFSGCGQQETPQVTDVTTPENILPAAVALGEGVLQGKVSFQGTPPQPIRLDMAADPVCAGAHSEPLLSEDLVVNSNQTLRHAFVYIKEGLPAGASFPVPAEAVTLDQNGCKYTPHVFGLRAGQTLTIVNNDPTLHNVHGVAKNSPEFNLGMPVQGMKTNKKFAQAEVMAKFKCDVHPWMSAYMGVMEHPFFAVTGEDGSFEIKGLPAGKYTLEVWQEKLGTKTVTVEIPAAGQVSTEITFEG